MKPKQTGAVLFLIGACFVALAAAFAPTPIIINRKSWTSQVFLLAVEPKYNKQTGKWDAPPGFQDEKTYGPVGSLLRHGPSPFVTRLTRRDEYEQAVLKYMNSEGCSKLEAQGNMDAYFNNPADWAYRKGEEKKGAPKVDYTELKLKNAVLVIVWALGITPFLLRTAFLIAVTGSWDVTLDQILDF